jgi:hypothetical protein
VKPVIALDVDGVLLPFRGDFELNPEHGVWLRELSDTCELVWATSWGYQANTELSPDLGLPDLPVVSKDQVPLYGAPRPLVWVDDMFHGQAMPDLADRVHATGRRALFVGTDPHVGLDKRDMNAIRFYVGLDWLP